MNLLFRIPEVVPTRRPDVAVLFGSLQSRHGITCDLVALTEGVAPQQNGCGLAFSIPRGRGRIGNLLRSFVLDLALIPLASRKRYDAIQVRDCIWGGLAALIAGRLFNKPVYYWASYLIWEGARARALAGGVRQGVVRLVYSRVRDSINGIVFKRFLLPRFDHVYVQSEAMRALFVEFGYRSECMTPIPMGVDGAAIQRALSGLPSLPVCSSGGPVLAYLGVLARERCITFLIDVLSRIRESYPTAKLLLVGDAMETEDRVEIEMHAAHLGLSEALEITGWVQPEDAWAILRGATLGLSALPRSAIFDVSFPTKVVEYMALGLAVVVNDIPAQEDLVKRSSGGLCVSMDVAPFSDAVIGLLRDPVLRRKMGDAGRSYVMGNLTYERLADLLALTYQERWYSNEAAV